MNNFQLRNLYIKKIMKTLNSIENELGSYINQHGGGSSNSNDCESINALASNLDKLIEENNKILEEIAKKEPNCTKQYKDQLQQIKQKMSDLINSNNKLDRLLNPS
jgi:endonuclease IV